MRGRIWQRAVGKGAKEKGEGPPERGPGEEEKFPWRFEQDTPPFSSHFEWYL